MNKIAARRAGFSVVAAGMAAAAVVGFQWSTSAHADAPVAAPASTNTVYLIDGTQPVSHPTSFTLSSADDNSGLSQVSWSSWGGATAEGTATYTENNCIPDCAQGSVISYPVNVTAEDLHQADGVGYYREVVLTFTQNYPSWLNGNQTTITLPIAG